MNERILELEAQCWEYEPSWTGVDKLVFNSKKFAKLIVKQCADISDASFHNGSAGYTAILNHFGVE